VSAAENVLPMPGPKPSASVVFISPEMASRWLERNTHNRKLRPSTVTRYARDMASGNWELTGEAIKFAADGTLLDGQHRLAAVIKAGATVPIYVVRGLAVEAQRVMDTGDKRSAAGVLQIAKHPNSTLLASTARLALGVEADLPDPGRHEATHSEIQEFVDANPDLEHAVDFARQIARKTDCPPAVVAYTFWQLAKIDTFAAANFWIAASDKVGLQAGDPVIALTNRFAESRRNRERLTKRIYLSLIYRAWNTRRDGKTMRFIRVNSPAGGLVPVPRPK
jgi:hypothetical protein